MKWFVLVWALGTGYAGPFDTQAECEAALAAARPNVIDPSFYQPPIKVGGICIQGIPAPWNQ